MFFPFFASRTVRKQPKPVRASLSVEQLETRVVPVAALNLAIQEALARDISAVRIDFRPLGNTDVGVRVDGQFIEGGSGLNNFVITADLGGELKIVGDERDNFISVEGFELSGNNPLTGEPLFSSPVNITIEGGAGDDRLNATAINDGKVIIKGEEGNDQINDLLFARGRGTRELDGGPGIDRINGGLGDEVINGGEGNDLIFLSEGNDEVNAGPGDDIITISPSFSFLVDVYNATIDGGPGSDVYNYQALPGLQLGLIALRPNLDFTITHTISDSGNADDLDTLIFSDRQGHFPDNDRTRERVGVNVNLAGGGEVVPGFLTINFQGSGSVIENVFGTPFSDTLIGNSADNILDGGGRLRTQPPDPNDGPNFDTIRGGGGNDILISEFENRNRPQLDANGNQRVGANMDGGPGDDILISTRGDDTLRGGPGNDTFVAAAGIQNGHDTIIGEGLCLDLDTIDLVAANLPDTVRGYPRGQSIGVVQFPLDLTSVDRQIVVVDNSNQPTHEVTLSSPQCVEQAIALISGNAQASTVTNPACEEPEEEPPPEDPKPKVQANPDRFAIVIDDLEAGQDVKLELDVLVNDDFDGNENLVLDLPEEGEPRIGEAIRNEDNTLSLVTIINEVRFPSDFF